MMRRRMMMQKKSSDWDYEWDWTSGEAPPMMTYSSFSITEDGAEIRNPNLDFNYVGDCEIEVDLKIETASAANMPQILIVNKKSAEQNMGFKIFCTYVNIFWNTNIIGSNQTTSIQRDVFRKITLRCQSGKCELTSEGVELSGAGSTDPRYLYYTGVYDTASTLSVFRSIKFRRL